MKPMEYFFGFQLPSDQEVIPSEKPILMWQNIFSWGWGEPDAVYLDELCPKGIAEFGTFISFPNWLATLCTLGFYSPQTVYIIPANL